MKFPGQCERHPNQSQVCETFLLFCVKLLAAWHVTINVWPFSHRFVSLHSVIRDPLVLYGMTLWSLRKTKTV